MQATIAVDVGFSGRNYHAPSALAFKTCEEVQREEGRPPALDEGLGVPRPSPESRSRDRSPAAESGVGHA